MKKLLSVLLAALLLAALAAPALAMDGPVVIEEEAPVPEADAVPEQDTDNDAEVIDEAAEPDGAGLPIDESSFPDPVFRDYVAESFDRTPTASSPMRSSPPSSGSTSRSSA